MVRQNITLEPVFADRLVPGVNGAGYGKRANSGTTGGAAGVLIDGMTNLAGFLPGHGAIQVNPLPPTLKFVRRRSLWMR